MIPKAADHRKKFAAPAGENVRTPPAGEIDRLRSEVGKTIERLEFERKWKLEGVVSERVKRKLDRCKSLLSTKYPNGVNYNTLFDELTEMFLDRKDPERRAQRREKRQVLKKQKTRDERPANTSRVVTQARPSRHISRSIKEKVWARDGGRCAFVGSDGKRCNSNHNLQFDHDPNPFARGGPSTTDNLRLLCAKHNRFTAAQAYGSKPR